MVKNFFFPRFFNYFPEKLFLLCLFLSIWHYVGLPSRETSLFFFSSDRFSRNNKFFCMVENFTTCLYVIDNNFRTSFISFNTKTFAFLAVQGICNFVCYNHILKATIYLLLLERITQVSKTYNKTMAVKAFTRFIFVFLVMFFFFQVFTIFIMGN